VKFTRYFLAMRRRADRAEIREEWIQRAIDQPIKETLQADGECAFGRAWLKWTGDICGL